MGIRLEWHAWNKHTSLLINYGNKKIYEIGPRLERPTWDKHTSLFRKLLKYKDL
jgi:hypothetical protein